MILDSWGQPEQAAAYCVTTMNKIGGLSRIARTTEFVQPQIVNLTTVVCASTLAS